MPTGPINPIDLRAVATPHPKRFYGVQDADTVTNTRNANFAQRSLVKLKENATADVVLAERSSMSSTFPVRVERRKPPRNMPIIPSS